MRTELTTSGSSSESEMETANEVEIESEEWATVAKKKGKIGKTKKNRSPGEDGIPYEMIQKLHESAMKVLLKIYNGSLPKDWMHAIILPILKPAKDSTKPKSYRPISLTSCLCKDHGENDHKSFTVIR